MKNVHILPTDKPSRLVQRRITKEVKISSLNNPQLWNNINIYITSDEEIKEGDYVVVSCSEIEIEEVRLVIGYYNEQFLFDDRGQIHIDYCKKIILTTDQDLDGVQAIDDEFLEWFVKNPSCEFVDTFIDAMGCAIEHCNANPCINYKIIIPTIQKFIEKHGITEQQLIDGYKQGLDLIFENASKIDKQETVEEAAKKHAYIELEIENHIERSECIEDFIAGAKSDAARDYWFKIFKEQFIVNSNGK